MIVKRIPAMPTARNRGGGRARHARQLVDYLRLPEKPDPYREFLIDYMRREKLPEMSAERLRHIGSRNFFANTLDGKRLEMMATAQAAVRSPNPIDHWLLSWRKGERPTDRQVDAAVEIFLGELCLQDAQCVYALHGDTHNRHVHIAINRYDPRIDRVIEINNGFNLEAGHRAVARIVDRFGWKAERDARYVMKNGRPVLSENAKARTERGDVAISANARAYQIRTGYKSLQLLGQEVALPIIDAATTWSELHAGLAKEGFQFEKKKNGAVLVLGFDAVRASSLNRRTSLARLEERFKEKFRPRADDRELLERNVPLDIMPFAHRAQDYRQVRLHDERNAAFAEITGAPRPKRKCPKDFESFLLEQGETYYADRWAGRASEKPGALIGKMPARWRATEAIDDFKAYPMADGVRYARPGGPTAFVDRGSKIEVTPGAEDAALLAAMKLAADKFGRFRVEGSDAFRERAVRLAVDHGLADHVVGIKAHAPGDQNLGASENKMEDMHELKVDQRNSKRKTGLQKRRGLPKMRVLRDVAMVYRRKSDESVLQDVQRSNARREGRVHFGMRGVLARQAEQVLAGQARDTQRPADQSRQASPLAGIKDQAASLPRTNRSNVAKGRDNQDLPRPRPDRARGS